MDTSNPEKISFTLRDAGGNKNAEISGTVDDGPANLGLSLNFEGYSDFVSNDENGTPVYIEKHNGELKIVIYADINQEDPTHIISLEGAKIEHRGFGEGRGTVVS